MNLYQYQQHGVHLIDEWRGRVLLADEQGLGKTAQTLCWTARHPQLKPVVVVCQATLKLVCNEGEVPLQAGQPPSVSSKTETKGWPAGDYLLRIYLSAPSASIDNASLGNATAKIVKERPK